MREKAEQWEQLSGKEQMESVLNRSGNGYTQRDGSVSAEGGGKITPKRGKWSLVLRRLWGCFHVLVMLKKRKKRKSQKAGGWRRLP